MTQKAERSPPADDTPTTQTISSRRRRLLTGSAAGGGVFLAMQAKTALGQTACRSPSAMISGNQSPRPDDGRVCSGGRSPGFWKQPQHFSYWTLTPPTLSVQIQDCPNGLGKLVSPCDISSPGTTINEIFPGAVGGNKSIWEVMLWPTNYPVLNTSGSSCTVTKAVSDVFGGQGQLLRHLACAYLNAGYFGSSSQDYPLTQAQVVEMWNAVKNGGTYCPSSLISCSGDTAMTAEEIIAYISSMYDLNADVEKDVCKK